MNKETDKDSSLSNKLFTTDAMARAETRYVIAAQEANDKATQLLQVGFEV
jgi:hypothetical protein